MSQAGPPQGGPTPIRRSARIGSAAGSVHGSRAQSVATTTATPSRAGAARRKGPLPKVKTRESHAYGSSSRVGAADALSVPVTGFAQAFGTQRNDAVTRDEEQDSEHESENGSIDELAANASRSRLQSVVSSREASPDAENESSLSVSNVDTSKSFGLVHEAGMTATREVHSNILQQRRNLGNAQHSRISAGTELPQLQQAPQFGAGPTLQQRPLVAQARPAGPYGGPRTLNDPFADTRVKGHAPIFVEPELKADEPRRWLKPVVGIFLIIGAALVSSYFLPTPWSTSLPASSSPGLFNAISSRITHSWDVLIEWVRDEDIPGVNSPIVDGYGTSVSGPRYEPLFSRTTKLERRAKAIESSLKILKQHLPSDIVVTRNEKGELEILNEFWRALVSKLKADGITNITHSFDGEWRTFLDKNRQKILDILRDEANNPELKHKNLEVLHRDEFISLMQDEYTKLGRLVDKKITEAYHSMSKGVKALIKDDVNKIIMDQIRIESLAMANLVANAEINLRKVNYFSTGLGARIDPYETSSTFIDDEPAVTSLYRRLFPGPGRRPPITALQKWDEPGDCWCASPDETNQGFAQLSILLGHEMYPQQVTVEHLPKAASLDSTSAPKNIEVWVPLPYDPSIRVWSAAGCGQGPKNHYCLGNFAYNVHGSNHVQTFNLDVHSIIPASKVLLRVTDNWGSDHTCIYRVRLHGEPVVAAE